MLGGAPIFKPRGAFAPPPPPPPGPPWPPRHRSQCLQEQLLKPLRTGSTSLLMVRVVEQDECAFL